ncbi:pyridoxal phosphate-dependent aminotransferase [Salinicoccus cyprini]|uniref:cysteine-S-conjugate beta-lyase n=1 Tax=Salinicoccus cyprini TaxID=2493691 RepID=A0A558AWX5_9STAP|nr:MalY/PatB family protein [Salinicoccus cyprini]TVT28762.1 pyridoxal phosphate-dependent aminotransferase [Salinicoccus cyprini]
MRYDFDTPINRRNTYAMKWDGGEMIKEFGLTERYDEDTIPLFTADMDFQVAEPIVEALRRTVDHQIFGYTIAPDAYYGSIQKWFSDKYDWQIEKQEIIYAPGTVHSLNVAVKAYSEKGDGVIIQRPVYPPFTSAIENNDRVVKNNAMIRGEDGRYSIDFEGFEALAKEEDTSMFIMCNPHNPTGNIIRPDELGRLAEICRENDVIIIADEIHGDLIRIGESFTPIIKTTVHTDHIVTLTAINKTFNLAGLHCTNVVIPDEALRTKFQEEQGMSLPSPFTVAALIAAYNEGDEWLRQVREYIDGNIDFVIDFLTREMPKVKVRRPAGTYVLWMDFSGYGISEREVHDRIYNEANVLLEDGRMFGPEGNDYQRICVPSPRSVLEEAMNRIKKAFSDLH